MRPLWPCCACCRRSPSGEEGNADDKTGGPDYSVWAQAQGTTPKDWGQKVYLTDLKRQSLAQPGYDQRMIAADWQQHRPPSSSQHGHGHGSPASSSPRGSTYHRSPASTSYSHTHLVTNQPQPQQYQYHSPSDNFTTLPRRISSLPASPHVGSPLAMDPQRDSFGHTPSMYAAPALPSGAQPHQQQQVSVPPIARVAYSPFAPRGSMLSPNGQRDSIRSERGYAV